MMVLLSMVSILNSYFLFSIGIVSVSSCWTRWYDARRAGAECTSVDQFPRFAVEEALAKCTFTTY